MLERILRPTVAVLIACLFLSGCSYFSPTARRQAAFQKYIRKHMSMRAKMQAKYRARSKLPKMPMVDSTPSKTKVTADVGSGPQSMTSGESQPSE
jgi:PBP1b-binding outer membrane lipoprotein LpoB